MAKNKKKKATLGGGVSTKSYKPSGKAATDTNINKDKKESGFFGKIGKWFMGLPQKARVLLACALLVTVLGGIATPIVIISVRNYRENNFDYLEADLTDYIDLDEDFYNNFPLVLDIAKPHQKNPDGTGVSDVEIVMLSLLATDKGKSTIGPMVPDVDATNAEKYKNGVQILPADVVYFWYRAYVVRDGKEIEITSNFYKSEGDIRGESYAYTVGEGAFPIAGIEGGLVGKNVKDYASFKKITEGEVKEGQVAYIAFTVVPVGGGEADKQTRSTVRINLADDEIKSKWLPVLEGAKIGEKIDDFRLSFDGVAYDYSNVKVEFVTECENGDDVLTLEGYAPYDFSNSELRNEDVKVDVYISGVLMKNDWHRTNTENNIYTLDFDWNDEYIAEKLKEKDHPITEEELLKYEGKTLAEKYENYIEKTIWENYEESKKQMVEDELWSYLLARAEVIKYPSVKVEKIYNEYRNDLTAKFDASAGSVKDQYTGETVVCETLDEFAVYYYGLNYSSEQDWEKYITRVAENLVKQRLVVYYLITVEELCTDEEYYARLESLKEEYLEEAIRQDTTDTSDYTKEEYEEYVEGLRNKLNNGLGAEYFRDQTHYEIVLEKMLKKATIYTLDDIKAGDRWVFDFMSGWI